MKRSIFDIIGDAKKSIPVDLQRIFLEEGIFYKEELFEDDDMAGMIESHPDGKYTISVNARDKSTRQRFTAAHELGHYVLHRPLFEGKLDDNYAFRKKGGYHNSTIKPLHEAQANKFAANLLMPSEMIVKYQKLGITDTVKLAEMFGVSEMAMRIRLEILVQEQQKKPAYA